MEFDWFTADAAARRALYDASKRAVFERFHGDWNAFLSAALADKANLGSGYIDNFRAGRISRVRSAAISQWLRQNEPHIAASLARDLAGLASEDRSVWQTLIDEYARDDQLTIVRFDQLGIVGLAANRSSGIPAVRRGEEFCLRLVSEIDGTPTGFQRSGALWFPLPLSDDGLTVTVYSGASHFPKSCAGDVLPLSEEADTGPVDFVILVGSAHELVDVIRGLEIGRPINHDEVARHIAPTCESQRLVMHRASAIIT